MGDDYKSRKYRLFYYVTSNHNQLSPVVSDRAKAKLQEFWEQYNYLAINEMSVITEDFFPLLSPNLNVHNSS